MAVADVIRAGDDQALVVGSADDPAGAGLEAGVRVEARVDHDTRHRTMRNHTATHLLHAALRERLGTHVRQAGSAVRPDKLRFDFTHGTSALDEEVREVEDVVNDWVKASARSARWRWSGPRRRRSARWRSSARSTATGCGWSRSTASRASSAAAPTSTSSAECGIFAIVQETSSAANVRRIEAADRPCGDRLVPRPKPGARARGVDPGLGAGSGRRGRAGGRAPRRARADGGAGRIERPRARRPRRSRPPPRTSAASRSSWPRAAVADSKALMELGRPGSRQARRGGRRARRAE